MTSDNTARPWREFDQCPAVHPVTDVRCQRERGHQDEHAASVESGWLGDPIWWAA